MIPRIAPALAILLASVTSAQAMDAQGAGRGTGASLVSAPPTIFHAGSHHPPSHRPPSHHLPYRPWLHGYPFLPYGGFALYAPSPLFGSSPYYAPAPVYDPSTMYSSAPTGGTVSIAPTPPPMPSVIPYPTGRYELRGDGLTSTYQWVWIPNPPAAPPAGASAPGPPPPAGPAASPRPPLYRWVDDEGIVNWTQGLDTVPEKYRGQLTSGRPS